MVVVGVGTIIVVVVGIVIVVVGGRMMHFEARVRGLRPRLRCVGLTFQDRAWSCQGGVFVGRCGYS